MTTPTSTSGNGSRHLKTGEAVADQLRRRIASGELPVGAWLPPEDELTATFGVARTTLREALRILESQGLITIRRGRGGGGTVTRPDLEHLAQGIAVALQLERTTVGDLDQARQLLEPRLAGWLAERHDEDDLAALREAVDAAAVAAEADDQRAFGRAAAQVHETVMERAGNRTLSVLSRLLHELVAGYYDRSASRADQATMRRAVRSYRKLLRLVEDGDGPATEDHWRRQMAFTIEAQARDEPLDVYR